MSKQAIITKKKERDSNIELYRIIMMLFIIGHHLLTSSSLYTSIQNQFPDFNGKSVYFLIFGAFGKAAINGFVLITGYFMCTSSFTFQKFVKLFAEVLFYNSVITIIFTIAGKNQQPFLTTLIENILPINHIGYSFSSCYLVFFLLIPFLNILIKNMNKKTHGILCLVLIGMFVIWSSLTIFTVIINYVLWFVVLYIIGSYIRLYSNSFFENTKLLVFLFLACFVLSCFTVWLGTYLKSINFSYEKLNDPFLFLADSNKILAFLLGVLSFLIFKNIKVPYSKVINAFSSTTFGVYLIHSNSWFMRNWLWNDVFNVNDIYNSDFFIVYSLFAVFAIFIACAFIDAFRREFLERPFMKLYDKLKKKNKKYSKV